MVKEITSVSDFTEAIGGNNTGLVVIDFYADWCGPCKKMAPEFQKLEEKYINAKFYKLNVDLESVSEVVKVCQISSLPTFCFFNKGNYVTSMVGADHTVLENMILQNIN